MKRRFFTAAVAFAFWRPSFAEAEPLPKLQETPMFADQVKSGALPPVDQRIPAAAVDRHAFLRLGRARPLGRPDQHADRQRARHAPDDALRQRAADRLRRPVQAAARHPRKLRGQGQQASSPSSCAPATDGRTASRSRPRTSASSGRTSPTTRSCRPAGRRSSCWSTASRPRSRSSTSARSGTAGTSPTPTSSNAQAQAAPLFLFRPAHYLKKFHTKYTSIRGDRQVGQGRPGQQLGADLSPPRRDVQQRQPGPAVAQPVDPDDAAAGAALRVRAQSLLLPDRREGRAAALPRPA